MKVGYIIGPFRAPSQWEMAQNIRNAEILGYHVAALGAMPLIPHSNTGNFHGTFTDEFWIEGTKELLHRADFAITVAALDLPWKYSTGSVGEVKECLRREMPVFHDLSALKLWLKENQ